MKQSSIRQSIFHFIPNVSNFKVEVSPYPFLHSHGRSYQMLLNNVSIILNQTIIVEKESSSKTKKPEKHLWQKAKIIFCQKPFCVSCSKKWTIGSMLRIGCCMKQVGLNKLGWTSCIEQVVLNKLNRTSCIKQVLSNKLSRTSSIEQIELNKLWVKQVTLNKLCHDRRILLLNISQFFYIFQH